MTNKHFLTFPFMNYNDRPVKELNYPSYQIQTSRGCPHSCIFCLWPSAIYPDKYEKRELDIIIAELLKAKKDYGIRSFYVDDDTFNINVNYINDFAEALIKNSINLPWGAMARADMVTDKGTLEKLKNSGLTLLKFGIESINEEVSKKIGKGLNLSKTEQTLKHCFDLNIKTHLTFTIGYPEDSVESIVESCIWSLSMNPDFVQVSIVAPFPGTEMYENAYNNNILKDMNNLSYDNFNGSMFNCLEDEQYIKNVPKTWVEIFKSYKTANAVEKKLIDTITNNSSHLVEKFKNIVNII